jgi:hypothetical protein
MTEIHIKRRPPVWPWLVGVLLLALVAWVAFEALDDDQPTVEQAGVQREGTVGTSGAVPAAIQDYSSFVTGQAQPAPGREHEYTAEGIRMLTAALGAFVEQNGNDTALRSRFERFRQSAQRLQQDPQSGAHADTVRDVFTSAVDVFESGRVDAGDVSRVRDTATSISADQPLLEQTEAVKRFFSQSAELLERAARRS